MSGLNLTLKIWRQKDAKTKGQFETVKINDVSPDMSFLEMLDIVNEEQMKQGKEGFAFDHDCREGICGMCALVINGMPHGPDHATTTCQLHMRKFKDGDTIVIEPWRAAAFPVIRDCAVDRTAFDRIIQAGGFISVNTGAAPEASTIPVPKADADRAFDAAACIGCGACVAACKNASAMLFVSAKVFSPQLLAAGQGRSQEACARHGRPDGQGRLRQLHEPLRMPGRLPEGYHRGLHRQDEPRIPRRHRDLRRKGVRKGLRGVRSLMPCGIRFEV